VSGQPPPNGYVDEFRRRGFELESRIGSGSSGSVYRARQRSLDRDVAIKVFDNPFSVRNERLRKRFHHEALMLGRLQHASLPTVLTCGAFEINGEAVPYTVLEYIQGATLEAHLAVRRRMDVVAAARTMSHVLSALSCAHAQKIVHRDVKPGNIILREDGHCFLIDFSIGVLLEGAPGLTRVTGDANQPGTVDYMAPEQRSGAEPSFATDLFSAGVVLFEMLGGHARVRRDHLDAELSHVPVGLRQIIAAACDPVAASRFESAEAFRRALARFESVSAPTGAAATAICKNTKCPSAQWTERGYYEGPRVVPDTHDAHCDACGNRLSYPCESCGAPYRSTPFCGACGASMFIVPECKQCGSWLTREDMDVDTSTKGCTKCRARRTSSFTRTPALGQAASADEDDIPF
jgi:serine/threonine protein kinase